MRVINKHDHPSGRPIRKDRTVGKPLWRIPDKGPVIPRLQPDYGRVSAIGFHVGQADPDEDE